MLWRVVFAMCSSSAMPQVMTGSWCLYTHLLLMLTHTSCKRTTIYRAKYSNDHHSTHTLFRQKSDLMWVVQHHRKMCPQGSTFRSTRLKILSLTVDNIIRHINHNTHFTHPLRSPTGRQDDVSVWCIQVKGVINPAVHYELVLLKETMSLPKPSIT